MHKILYISPNGYLGGAERFVVTVAISHKANNKVDASILFFSQGEATQEALKSGVNCIVLKNSFRIRNPFNLLRALIEIRKIVKDINPDALHLTMPYSHIVLSLATLGMGIKKVWFQHGPVGGRLDQIANLFPVDMIWYNSQYLKQRHHQTWPSPKVIINESIIKLGIKGSKSKHELFLNSSPVLGTAGRICSWKGFHLIISALGELKKEHGVIPYKFFIAGDAKTLNDKKYSEELKSLVEAFGLTDQVQFLKHVERMEDYYQSLDIFIHSSIIPEPFGLVVAEAMVNGCLVVGSDQGGVKDILKNGETGLSFPSTSIEAIPELKKILYRLLMPNSGTETDDLRLMAKAGRELVERDYSLLQMTKSIEGQYDRLLQK